MNDKENDISNKLKEILFNMNTSEMPLENFYELMEKETGGKLTFTSFKTYMDKYYDNINKSNSIIHNFLNL
jgi:hypothetical protein